MIDYDNPDRYLWVSKQEPRWVVGAWWYMGGFYVLHPTATIIKWDSAA